MIIKTLKDIKKQLGFGDFRAFFVFFLGKFQSSTIIFKNMLSREDTFLFKQNTYILGTNLFKKVLKKMISFEIFMSWYKRFIFCF